MTESFISNQLNAYDIMINRSLSDREETLVADKVLNEEQQHLKMVLDKIDQAIAKTQGKADRAKTEAHQLDHGFDNIHINTTTYSGMMDTAVSVRAQQQMLDERQNSWQHATQQLSMLQRLRAKPYFARIDFQEKGAKKPETIYIGLASFNDRPDNFLVYDWRAPISSIYYDGGLGKVSYQTPDGPQEVNVSLKRQFQIEDGVIVTLYDTDEAVTDQMLLSALSNHSGTKMKSIVSTIQQTQNQIIRDTKSDLLFVQGAAGSGKTAVVLQRVAWLLYRYRGKLTSSQVIMFSPNQLFNDYVDSVLPELGEHNMVQMTYFQFVNRRVPRYQVATLQQRFEATQDETGRKINDLLTSRRYFDIVTRYAKSLGHANLHFRNIMFHQKPFVTKERLAEIYYSFNNNYNLGNRLDGTKEELIKYLNRRVGSEMRSKWVEQRLQSLSQEDINDLFRNRPREFANEDEERRFFARQIVMKELLPVKRAIDHNNWININAQYVHLLRHTPQLVNLGQLGISHDQWQAFVDRTVDQMRHRQLSAAGVSIYIYLYDLLTGRIGDRRMRYVFIDEVQDYDAFQLAYLKYSFPEARFTMLGDLNQAIFTDNDNHSLLEQLGTMFDRDKTRVLQLTKTYRSTKQITDFTRHILTHGEAIEPFDREGKLPRVVVKADEKTAVDEVVATLKNYQQEHDTTAIIGKTLADSQRIADLLKERGVKTILIKGENQRLVPGTIVVPSYLAKGLEFDATIVWNANDQQYGRDDQRRLLYTICSRAMHELTLVAIGKVTPLIDKVPRTEYTMDN